MSFVLYMCLSESQIFVGLDINIMLYTTPKQNIQLAAGKIFPNTIFILKELYQSLLKVVF